MTVRQNLLLFLCTSTVLVVLLLLSLDEGMDSESALVVGASGPVAEQGAEEGSRAGSVVPSPTKSPAEVAARLRDLHDARDYDELASWLVEDGRDQTVTLLQAVDDVIDANAALLLAAEKHYHTPASEGWNLEAMRDNLGPFSSRLRIINQKFVGDVAYVTLQEGDNIPLVQARFEWADGRWKHCPVPAPASIVPELHRLAKILRDIAGSVEKDAPFEAYMDAFHYRVLPQMARVVSVTDEPGNFASASVGERAGASLSAAGDPEATN